MSRRQARAGTVRIVGGQWRGTRLPVADLDGLRPSADRVRETLFNWLMPALPDARVLDAFAGSGALGLEAVSRGAARATLVERDAGLATSLRATCTRLQGGEAVELVQGDALAWMRRAADEGRAYDIAFLDPPFSLDLWAPALDAVLPLMAAEGWLYVEAASGRLPPLPSGWRPHREGRTREVDYALWRHEG